MGKESKVGLKKKRRREKGSQVDANNIHADEHADNKMTHLEEIHHANLGPEHRGLNKEKKIKSSLKKKRRREKGNEVHTNTEEKIEADEHAARSRHKKNYAKRSTRSQTSREDGNPEEPTGTNNRTKIKAKKVNKEMKHKKNFFDIVKEPKSEETLEVDEEKVEEILSVDEDCSQGMKRDY